jgi:(p)ppGpp synthase/HD superfamily hydrolase
MADLRRALQIAEAVHGRARDRAGRSYIDHVYRVMSAVNEDKPTMPDAVVVAALHDVLEDGGEAWNAGRLLVEGFSPWIVEAVDAITRRPGEDYSAFIERVAANPLATIVKRADLRDNLRLDRLPEITLADLDRAEKYIRALRRLMQ